MNLKLGIGLAFMALLLGLRAGRTQEPSSAVASPTPATIEAAREIIDVPPPDPKLADHTEIVQKAAQQCLGKSNPVLRFSPGTYILTPSSMTSPQGGLKFMDIRGLTIEGRGAVLMMEGKFSALYFKNCTELTVKDLTIDSVKPFFAQGKIVGGTENSIDIEIDPAFPLPENAKIEALMDYDPVTRLPIANLDIFGNAITKTQREGSRIHLEFRRSGNPKKRVHLAKWFPASVGKLVILRMEIHGHYGVDLLLCRDVLLQNISIYSAAGMALHAQECENITSRGVQIRIKPGSGRLMSTTIDCQYYTFCKGSIVVEDGFYEGMGDDGFNVTAKYRKVVSLTGDNSFDAALPVKLGWIGALPVPGEKLIFQRPKDMTTIGTWTVTNCVYDVRSKQLHITVAEPLKGMIAPEDLWYSETYLPKVEIRRSTFRGMRARGILLSTRDILIEDCKIQSPGYSGILLKGGLRHGCEGPVPSNVTIRSCTFEGTGGAAIYGYADGTKIPAGALHDIIIENNTFREMSNLAAVRFKQDDPLRMHWASAISLLAGKNITIRGNKFEGYPVALYLNNTKDAKVEGNQATAATQIMLEKASTENVQTDANTNLTVTDAPPGIIADLEYMNDFR